LAAFVLNFIYNPALLCERFQTFGLSVFSARTGKRSYRAFTSAGHACPSMTGNALSAGFFQVKLPEDCVNDGDDKNKQNNKP
jgi:hypothetical protein